MGRSELVLGGGAVARGKTGLATTDATAWSTERISFSGEVVTWDQLPVTTHRAARRSSSVIAQAVQIVPGQHLEGGRAFEHATGWRVHESAVVLVDVARPVVPGAFGGTRPAGPWEHRRARLYEASGSVRRREGVIDVADELVPESSGTSTAPEAHQGLAAAAWGYLPRVVRSAAERLVPTPLTWLGEIVQERTPDGFPTRQRVTSLRMSAERAVVILASRTLTPIPGAGVAFHVTQMARVPWVVEQVGLDLEGPGGHVQLGSR